MPALAPGFNFSAFQHLLNHNFLCSRQLDSVDFSFGNFGNCSQRQHIKLRLISCFSFPSRCLTVEDLKEDNSVRLFHVFLPFVFGLLLDGGLAYSFMLMNSCCEASNHSAYFILEQGISWYNVC